MSFSIYSIDAYEITDHLTFAVKVAISYVTIVTGREVHIRKKCARGLGCTQHKGHSFSQDIV